MSPPTEPAPPNRALSSAIVACVVVFVLLRVLLAFAGPTQLYHNEEYVNLRLAAALLGEDGAWPDGYVPPPARERGFGALTDYQFQEWDGGTLAVAVTLVPIAAVGGLSVFTIKTGALLWALGIMLAWTAVVGRLYGRVGALITAAAFAAAPVPWLILSSIQWGNHAESALFVPLLLLLLLAAADEARWRRAALLVGAAGLVAGFGTWFSLLNLLPLALVATLLVLPLGWRGLLTLPVFAAGVLVGFLPWFTQNPLQDLGGISAQSVSLSEVVSKFGREGQTPGGGVHAAWPIFADWDLHGLWAPDGAVQQFLETTQRYSIPLVGTVAILAALVLLRRSDERPRARQRLFVLEVCASSYVILPLALDAAWALEDRRVAPLYPAGIVLVAAGLASLAEIRRGPILAALLAAIVLLPGLAAEVRLVTSWDRPNAPLRPWMIYAPPAAPVRDRYGAGIAAITSGEVAVLNAVVEALLRDSTDGGAGELRGLSWFFIDDKIGDLRSQPARCPGWEKLAQQGDGLISDAGYARGLGMGLAMRCRDQPDVAAAVCLLPAESDLRQACWQGWSDALPLTGPGPVGPGEALE